MDLAITYRCNNNCYFCYTGGPRNVAELNTSDWKHVLDKLWDSGIPQVVFTGGEPTLRDDLPAELSLISKAREYHVNHIQLSHDIMMYAWQPIDDTARRSRNSADQVDMLC
jgi:MoaA/NifB/PqqE/SkfB family radical SAM enzyme